WLRSEHLDRRRRTEGHAGRNRREAQQRDQRGPRRSQNQGASRGLGRHYTGDNARRLRQAHCRRNREVGQGDPRGQHQGGMKRRFTGISERDVMKLPRRNFLHLAAGAAALLAVPRIARSQAYPSRPVHWIVSFAAGGPNDIVARIIGQYLSDHLGQQFIIENRPGAGGNVGMQSVLSSAPDGYTIAFVGPNYAINPTLYDKLPFNFIRDSAPVA